MPLIAISVMITNLPVPQFAYGGVSDEMTQLELARGLTDRTTHALPARFPAPIRGR